MARFERGLRITGGAKNAFTLIEMLVVISIIALLAAILFPVFGRVRENGRRSACLSNQKQIGLALLQYAQDYDETGPRETFGTSPAQHVWMDALIPYVNNFAVYVCPSHVFPKGSGPISSTYVNPAGVTRVNYDSTHLVSYAVNRNYYLGYACDVPEASTCSGAGNRPRATNPFSIGGNRSVRLSQIASPSETVYLTDSSILVSQASWILSADLTATDGSARSTHVYRHAGLTNVLMCDGHVKAMKQAQLVQTHDVPNLDGNGTTPVSFMFTVETD